MEAQKITLEQFYEILDVYQKICGGVNIPRYKNEEEYRIFLKMLDFPHCGYQREAPTQLESSCKIMITWRIQERKLHGWMLCVTWNEEIKAKARNASKKFEEAVEKILYGQ